MVKIFVFIISLLNIFPTLSFAETYSCQRERLDASGFSTKAAAESWYNKNINITTNITSKTAYYKGGNTALVIRDDNKRMKAVFKRKSSSGKRLDFTFVFLPNGEVHADLKTGGGYKSAGGAVYKCSNWYKGKIISASEPKTKSIISKRNSNTDISNYSDYLICLEAVSKTGGWEIRDTVIHYVKEAERRGLTCGVSSPRSSMSALSYSTYSDEAICNLATDKGYKTSWRTSNYGKEFVNQAKRRGLTCGVVNTEKENRLKLEQEKINKKAKVEEKNIKKSEIRISEKESKDLLFNIKSYAVINKDDLDPLKLGLLFMNLKKSSSDGWNEETLNNYNLLKTFVYSSQKFQSFVEKIKTDKLNKKNAEIKRLTKILQKDLDSLKTFISVNLGSDKSLEALTLADELNKVIKTKDYKLLYNMYNKLKVWNAKNLGTKKVSSKSSQKNKLSIKNTSKVVKKPNKFICPWSFDGRNLQLHEIDVIQIAEELTLQQGTYELINSKIDKKASTIGKCLAYRSDKLDGRKSRGYEPINRSRILLALLYNSGRGGLKVNKNESKKLLNMVVQSKTATANLKSEAKQIINQLHTTKSELTNKNKSSVNTNSNKLIIKDISNLYLPYIMIKSLCNGVYDYSEMKNTIKKTMSLMFEINNISKKNRDEIKNASWDAAQILFNKNADFQLYLSVAPGIPKQKKYKLCSDMNSTSMTAIGIQYSGLKKLTNKSSSKTKKDF